MSFIGPVKAVGDNSSLCRAEFRFSGPFRPSCICGMTGECLLLPRYLCIMTKIAQIYIAEFNFIPNLDLRKLELC